MLTSKKYRHIGYSFPGVPAGWVPIVEKSIKEIEESMWPKWIPLSIKRKIHYLATGNSVNKVRSRFWNRIRDFLTYNQIITDIKCKYGTLRIYGQYGPEIDYIIKKTEKLCSQTCEACGSQDQVKIQDLGWVYNFCVSCRKNKFSGKKSGSPKKSTKK